MELLWERTLKIFPILSTENQSERLYINEYEESDIESLVSQLLQNNLDETVYELVFIEINSILRKTIVPKFWSHYAITDTTESDNDHESFNQSVCELFDEYTKVQTVLKRLSFFKLKMNQQSGEEKFNVLLKASLLSQLPLNFNQIIHNFYSVHFKVLINHKDQPEQMFNPIDNIEITLKCDGCDKEREDCQCESMMRVFNTTNRYLNDMDLLTRLAGRTITEVIQEKIEGHIRETCQGSSDVSHINRLEIWLKQHIFHWLPQMYENRSTGIVDESESIENLTGRFMYHLYETYSHSIINEFFNIIIGKCKLNDYVKQFICFDDFLLQNIPIQNLQLKILKFVSRKLIFAII